MEENSTSPVKTADQTNPAETSDGYVAPEVLAAQAGEIVEFGKNLDEAPDDN